MHPRRSRRYFFATRGRCDPDRGLAGGRPASAPVVANPVLGEVGVVGVGGPEHLADLRVVAAPRVDVLDEEGDRGPGGDALEDAGEDPDLVGLAPLGGVAAAPRGPPVEVGLDVGLREGEAGRAPVHHAPDRRPVALPERGHREVCSERVSGHANPVPLCSNASPTAIVRNVRSRHPAQPRPAPDDSIIRANALNWEWVPAALNIALR